MWLRRKIRLDYLQVFYDMAKFILCNLELPVTNMTAIGTYINEDALLFLLEKKLQCDKHLSDI